MAILDLETGLVSFENAVVDIISTTDRVMSDIYAQQRHAVVWNAEKAKFENVLISSSFELSTIAKRAKIDATPAIRAKYEVHNYKGKLARDYSARKKADEIRNAETNGPSRERKGERFTIVRGRKRKGETGTLEVYMRSKFGAGYVAGLDIDGEIVWVNADYCAPEGLESTTGVHAWLRNVRANADNVVEGWIDTTADQWFARSVHNAAERCAMGGEVEFAQELLQLGLGK